MKRKGLVVGISLVLLLALTITRVEAGGCCHNPVLFPLAIAGAVVGTAAALTSAVVPAPVYPAYYASPPPPCGGPVPNPSRPAWGPRYYGHGGYWDPHYRR